MCVGVVDPLNDFLAELVLEVDVDIRRLVALLGNEPLEEQVVRLWVDGRDPENVTDAEFAADPRPWQRMPCERA
nr:hypothetical protein KS05_13365 [Rhizobium brockwellii]